MIRQIILVLGLLFLVALNAEARTYIQCAGQASDRVVVNLDDAASTLFMTSGVDDPDEVRVLKKIKLYNETEKSFEYMSVDEEIMVSVPRHVVGNILNGFEVILTFLDSEYEYKMPCYSNVF
ncbi:MAG: hypothetical protein CME71_09080 [Halobacteriovorax sp.]|nr:hypothetical protein [Halobacteriovorax sp.]